jgi:AcrR family transcriptional regulator
MRYRVGLETRDRILEATRALVGEARSYQRAGRPPRPDGTTIKAICDRAGILAGSFYNLFDSKEEAVLSVVREAIQAVEPDPEQAMDIVALVDAYADFFEQQEAMARVYLEVAVSGSLRNEALRSRVMRHHEQRLEIFSAALGRAGIDDPSEVAELLIAALNGLALHRLLDPTFDLRSQARRLLEMRVPSHQEH